MTAADTGKDAPPAAAKPPRASELRPIGVILAAYLRELQERAR